MSLRIVSGEAFLRAVRHADTVELAASLLPRAQGGIVDALEAAASRGAHVRVALEAEPYDPSGSSGPARANRAMVALLRGHGVDACLAPQTRDAPLHLKAAIVDEKLFLDDRNWVGGGRDMIVASEDARDIAAVRGAIHGRMITDPHLALSKRDALRLEAATISSAAGLHVGIAVESESFGEGIVARALSERARAGDDVRLLVSARDIHGTREAGVLARLSRDGVRVRVESGSCDEKLCVAGERAWVGSANATSGFPKTIDWGARTRAHGMVDALREAFERNWSSARAFSQTS